jgi:electron transfer flavoprotein beta subunit
MPVPVEMQAIRMAADLGVGPYGLHVGAADAVRDALGHGLSRLLVIQAGNAETQDVLPALLEHLRRLPPELILAGRRGQGGSDTGMLPYRVADALGWPIVADVVKLRRIAGGVLVEQALPRGRRREVQVPIPCVVTVHPAAPAAQAFRHAGLCGEVVMVSGAPGSPMASAELRPYRMRPKLIAASKQGGQVRSGLSAEQAAAAILAELRGMKIL